MSLNRILEASQAIVQAIQSGETYEDDALSKLTDVAMAISATQPCVMCGIAVNAAEAFNFCNYCAKGPYCDVHLLEHAITRRAFK